MFWQLITTLNVVHSTVKTYWSLLLLLQFTVGCGRYRSTRTPAKQMYKCTPRLRWKIFIEYQPSFGLKTAYCSDIGDTKINWLTKSIHLSKQLYTWNKTLSKMFRTSTFKMKPDRLVNSSIQHYH